MTKIKCPRLSWWIRVLTVVCTWSATDGLFHIVAPVFYVAFSGDLVVNYTIPTNYSLPNAFIRLVSLNSDIHQEITTLGIPMGHPSGSLKISCGVIEFPGSYSLQMCAHVGAVPLTHRTLDVRWPTVTMFLPNSFIAQTQSATVMISSQANCPSLLHRYKFHLDLEYTPEPEIFFQPRKPEVIHSEPYSDISSKTTSKKFSCNLFNVPGTYRAVLRSTFNNGTAVGQSNPMRTRWSEAYKINIFSKTVFPCVGSLPVYYAHPSCSGQCDKIRMYLLKRQVSGSLAAPVERIYVMERFANPDKTSVVFSCDLFNTTAVGYCFVYVTVTSKGAVTEQHRSCISAHPDSVLPIDGGWSEWSPWGACTVACGVGKFSRFRMCTNPSTSNGGQFCPGNTVEWKPCSKNCPDNIPLTPLHSPQVNGCPCGCTLNQSSGEIIATGRCQGLSVWRLRVKPGQCIKLTFLYFDLFEDKQWVKIRNGDSSSADLLAFSSGGTQITDIISSSNTLLIEFMTESPASASSSSAASTILPALLYTSKPTRRIHVHGFIATYSTHENNMTTVMASASPIRRTENGAIWQSTVTLLGIGLCVLIVIAALAFVVYNRVSQKRKHKYGMAPQDDSPHHVPRSTSNHSSPIHGIEIEHDMQAPLTGDVSKKKERKESAGEGTKSRGNSISSNCSNGLKKFKKSDVPGGGSPRPSPRAYTPLATSPEEKGPSDEITVEHSSLFKVSPLLSGRKPKSPKIHPSPRLKRNSKPTTPVTPTVTKEDMLKRKRHKKDKTDDVRVVTGAASAPAVSKGRVTFSAISPGTITLKAAVSSPEESKLSKKEKKDKKHKFSSKLTGKSKARKEKEQKSKENDGEKKDINTIPLADVEKCDPEVVRNPGSGTSDESSSALPDTNQNEDNQQTTSFIQEVPQSAKPRRPTSLIESYSKQSIEPKETPSGIVENTELTMNADRQSALPKPDGQSPKSARQESKSSTPRSVLSCRSNKTMSPARSIHTPSDIASLELEYDDFIDYDDTYSYFDPIETEKLTWHGIVEKLENKPKESSD